jgi:glycosyltransferase involved in cell wall biosynthesis
MNESPTVLVSIVITSFNYEKFVAAAIRSALDQTYPHRQVIVVDDGSTDGSRPVIESFGDRVLAIYQENAGETAATNTGFAAAHGDIVMFLDSDDTLRPDAVAQVVAAFRPGVSKVQFCLATIDAAGDFAGNVFPNYPSSLTSDMVRREVQRTGL